MTPPIGCGRSSSNKPQNFGGGGEASSILQTQVWSGRKESETGVEFDGEQLRQLPMGSFVGFNLVSGASLAGRVF